MASEKMKFVARMRIIKKAGLGTKAPNVPAGLSDMESLDERVQKINGIVNKPMHNPLNMIFFIMYDIENNKVRTAIAKFLQKSGCIRVQKSIFLADLPREKYTELHSAIKQVQEVYDNSDSVLFIPVATDELRAMKMVGKNIDIDFITGGKSTLFF